MLVVPTDLRELFETSGGRFQHFVTALIMKEALACGLNPTDIDSDYRTNHPDGGCDIFIRTGQSRSAAAMIPDKPSIWSLKAGTNGISPSKLAEELKDKAHPRLTKHLQAGDIYVWCALEPAGQIDRKAMSDKADALAKELGFDPSLIRFVWSDHLSEFVNNHLNLIGEYLPNLHEVIKPMMTLAQWASESPDRKGLRVPWVALPGGDVIKHRVKTHLLGNSGDAVFHLAGLSGIGKTRAVIEACLGDPALLNTLYIGTFSDIGDELWRRLRESRVHARLIFDEVPLQDVGHIQDRFSDAGARIRIVSIGPAPRGQARRQHDSMLEQMEPPDEKTGVLPVVNAASPDLGEDVRRSIAHFAGNDLRLALLLVDATRRNGRFSSAPLHSYEDVWQRIVSRFHSQIQDKEHFRELYELLTIAIDVGYTGDHRPELRLIASHFQKSETDFDRAIHDANECGLGDRMQFFFEAKPRALAVWLFQERLWPILDPRLEEFVAAKPSTRLLRRVLERCQETASPFREEVEARLGGFFFKFLGSPDLKLLVGREASRVFQAWAEFDPKSGLSWLEQAMKRASDDDLRSLEGDADGSGGWRGRRQLVWLCEHLACFAEYFFASERILFRLAQVETEIRIGNNSTNTWREMFLPALANTEVPFGERLSLLGQRLKAATNETIDLILSAYYASIERHISRMVPPSIVGGRIVPDQWKPQTVQELEECRVNAARSVLTVIPTLADNIRRRAANSVVDEAGRFLVYGLVDELRIAVEPCLDDESLKRRVLLKLDDQLSWYERQKAMQSLPPWFQRVRNWRDHLSPATFQERVKDLTSRDYWSVYRVSRRRVANSDPEEAYAKLAQEIIEQPAIIDEIASWLRQPEAVSGAMLLFQLGLKDSGEALLERILKWLRDAAATNLVANYLRGVQRRAGQLPEAAKKMIETVALDRPGDALHITLLSDYSEGGLHRFLALLPRLKSEQRSMLRQISADAWASLLGTLEKQILLEQLCVWGEAGDPLAAGIAIDLISMWRPDSAPNLPAALTPALIRLAKLSQKQDAQVDDYEWKVMMEALAFLSPQDTAELLADAITDVRSDHFQRREYAQEVFAAMAKDHPAIAMQAIGKWVLDTERGAIFRMWEFRGLFDAIGLSAVKVWVQEHGNVAAIGIARHLDGPRVENGSPVIPELADWLLSAYSHVPKVFNEFAMGRHSGETRWGHARDREQELYAFLKHFESSPKEWVREWVEYERASHRREVEWDSRRDEEDGRI